MAETVKAKYKRVIQSPLLLFGWLILLTYKELNLVFKKW